MVCSIFIASMTTTGSPLATRSPGAASTLTTVPGIGATSEPDGRWASRSGKRSTGRSTADPSVESTCTLSLRGTPPNPRDE